MSPVRRYQTAPSVQCLSIRSFQRVHICPTFVELLACMTWHLLPVLITYKTPCHYTSSHTYTISSSTHEIYALHYSHFAGWPN